MLQQLLQKQDVWTDTYNIILLDGSQFHQHKLSDQGNKFFTQEFPKLYKGNNKYLMRKIYTEIADHGQNYGIYLQPYLIIHVDSPPQGFTVGNGKTGDVPPKLQACLSYWNQMLFKGLKRADSSLNIPNRDAFVFLTKFAKNRHPNFITNPWSLVKTTTL